MLIQYRDGTTLVGILLSLKGGRMRVAVRDAEDVAEYLLINEFWISENGDPVTFDFPTAIFEAVGIVPDQHNVSHRPGPMWEDEFEGTSRLEPLN